MGVGKVGQGGREKRRQGNKKFHSHCLLVCLSPLLLVPTPYSPLSTANTSQTQLTLKAAPFRFCYLSLIVCHLSLVESRMSSMAKGERPMTNDRRPTTNDKWRMANVIWKMIWSLRVLPTNV